MEIRGRDLDQPSVNVTDVHFMRSVERRCVAVGIAERWRGDVLEHGRPNYLDSATSSSIPFGITADLDRLHERDHLHRRRNEPQFDPLRHQHVEQWFDVVTSEPTRERSRSHRDLLLGLQRLHCRGQHRQHRGRFHHHGDDHRGSLVDGANPAAGYQSVAFGFMPEHRRLLRGGGELGSRLGQCRVRMERAVHSFRRRRPQCHFVCDHIRLHRGGLRHLREPRHHRHHRRGHDLDL